MTFKRIDSLIQMIGRFRGTNFYNRDIVVLVGLNTLTELRSKARSWISRQENGPETFGGCKIKLEANKGVDYLAIAYDDPRDGYIYLTEILDKEA